MNKFNDGDFMKRLGNLFNKMNPNAEVNGKRVDFAGYLKAFHDQNHDWVLGEYKKLPKLSIPKTQQSAYY